MSLSAAIRRPEWSARTWETTLKRLAALGVLVLLLAACEITITAPEEGTIVPASSVTVTGTISPYAALGGTLLVDGAPATIGTSTGTTYGAKL